MEAELADLARRLGKVTGRRLELQEEWHRLDDEQARLEEQIRDMQQREYARRMEQEAVVEDLQARLRVPLYTQTTSVGTYGEPVVEVLEPGVTTRVIQVSHVSHCPGLDLCPYANRPHGHAPDGRITGLD